jgi:hypothetical protein
LQACRQKKAYAAKADRVHKQQGQYSAALEKYEEALGLMQQYSSPQNVAIVEQDIARVKGKMSSA